MSDQEEKPAQPARKRRRWLRRVGWTFLILFLLLAIFHRPIIFEGTRYFIVRAAKQQKLDLDYKIGGSIFTTLTVTNLAAKPTEPGPIQRLEIGEINLRYSLYGLARHGLPGLLRLVELKNVFIEITPSEFPPPAKQAQPQKLKFPALFPDVLNIANVNFISHAKEGDTVLEGFFFSLLPDRPGELKIQTLDIPGVRKWTGITGATTFRDRKLVLTNLAVGPEIALKTFRLDASRLDESQLQAGLEGDFFGAATKLEAQVTDLNASNRLALTLASSGLDFAAIWKYLHLSVPLQGRLDNLSASFSGEPELPKKWSGQVHAAFDGLGWDKQEVGAVTADVSFGGGGLTATVGGQFDDKNSYRLDARAALPEKLDGFAKTDASGTLALSVPDLALLTQSLPAPVTGDVAGKIDFWLKNGWASAQADLQAAKISAAGAELDDSRIVLHADKDLEAEPGQPVFQNLFSRVDATIRSLRFQDYAADAFQASVAVRNGDVAIESVSLAKSANSLFVSGSYTLPADLKSWDQQPLAMSLGLNAPDLQAFVSPGAGASLKGTLTVSGTVNAQKGVYNAAAAISGRGVLAQGLSVRSVDARLDVAQNQATLSRLAVVFDDKNAIRGSGDAQLAAPFAYCGAIDVKLSDLSAFRSLLGTGKSAPALAGSLAASWKGEGQARPARHSGQVSLDLTGGQFDAQKDLSAHLAGSYSPTAFSIPDLRLAAGQLGKVGLSLAWEQNRLKMTNLRVRQQKLVVLEGSAEVPLHLDQLQDLHKLLPGDEPLSVVLRTNNLDLRTLFSQLGQSQPPITGTVNFTCDASGTLDRLAVASSLRATRLQSPQAANFDPADVSLDIGLRDNRLGINGTVRQRLIQPLQITGNIPFDLAKIRASQKLDPDTPVDLRVVLPRSQLDFVASLVPAIRQIRGDATINVNVRGTIGRPQLAGAIETNLSTLRFTDPNLPPVSGVTAGLNFTENRVTISRCRGSIGGGTFSAAGSVVFSRLDNPVLDLRLGTQNALAMQNDDLTVRVSSDLTVRGPMNAGTVAGHVYVTRSRFFKNIDILPIGLPGRPAPQPPPEPTVISFPKPPLRDWKFDITIKTSDPFLVQSNLANGRIVIDLHVGGTGLRPWMDGTVRIERLVASLPFSRLDIDSGIIFFSQAEPFEPQLNIRGQSNIGEYNVNVYIYGTAANPQAVFSSDPPLTQADIVSLLATGMTAGQLTKDPNALAGRALLLLVQKAYHSIFRRNRPPSENEGFLSRLQFDIGTVDPKTGHQAIVARLPLTDNLILAGGMDVGGNFRGQVKYIIRFR